MFSRDDYCDSLLGLALQIVTLYRISNTDVQDRNTEFTLGAIVLEKNNQLSDLVHQIKNKTSASTQSTPTLSSDLVISDILTISTRISTICQAREVIIPELPADIGISSA
ncbi:hypothetical protein ABGY98_004202 [Salmonella enterica]|uniref:Uncharacterized protein n=1 Tax=Salmonella enterica subsp. diarizonae serovar 48:i:z TaxID=1192842 RepID=A0A7U6BF40_SALDZ|nr:hypothetical protein [Salmonella enterica]EAA4451695.1 hypothetical protein [Salmonella enterica subsp. diarizonae]EDW6120804.1 hypothetical protein [Salmonella enterica subsp. salamae]AXC74177.1 hypothetical protein DOE59_23125 [Salmonella enterica subsp. diarizonae serovar 48:i:z]EAM6406196.1 hypothetical protein [Salmonella enterica]EAN2412887.1 hypothetical protein [Salmonella enterica]